MSTSWRRRSKIRVQRIQEQHPTALDGDPSLYVEEAGVPLGRNEPSHDRQAEWGTGLGVKLVSCQCRGTGAAITGRKETAVNRSVMHCRAMSMEKAASG